jgi:hypothetical protein
MLNQDAPATPTESLAPTQANLEKLTEIIALRFEQKVVVSDLHFTPLSGTHQVWECAFEINAQTHTHTHTERLIVKQLHEHAGQAFSFQSTFALQQRLFAIGIAAEPIYLSPQISSRSDGQPHEHDLLWVEAFVPVSEIEQSLTPPQKLARVLAQLHQTSFDTSTVTPTHASIRQLDPINQCQILMSAADTANTSSSLTQALDILINDMQSLKSHRDDPVLCHNDLHLNHVRSNNICVDWEYAALGPRYFDVAMCIVINRLTPTAQTQLLKEYAQLTDCNVDTATQQTALYIRLALMINQAWARLL